MPDRDFVDAGVVPLGCPDCGLHVLAGRDSVASALDEHNDSKHGGRPIAGISILDHDGAIHFVPHPEDMTDDQFAFVQAVLDGGDGGDHGTPWEVTD